MDNPLRARKVVAEDDMASRGARFGAVVLDFLILVAIQAVLDSVVGHLSSTDTVTSDTYLINSIIGFAVFCAVNGHFLAKRGQTIGKRIIGVRIVCGGDRVVFARQDEPVPSAGQTGTTPPLWRSLGLRYGCMWILGGLISPLPVMDIADNEIVFPWLSYLCVTAVILANFLLIFRDGRQCGHDILAGTLVVKADWVKPAPSTETGEALPSVQTGDP